MPARIMLPLILLISSLASAEPSQTLYDRISLNAQAGEEVENDLLIATLYAQREGSDAEQLAEEVNRIMDEAINEARKQPGVSLQTLDYSTQPVYGKGSFSGAPKLAGWRIRQSLRLESRDSVALGNLIGRLQESLAVNHIRYSISDQRREASLNRIIASAIANFKSRAELISREMGRDGYRLVNMSVNTSGQANPYPVRALAMEAKSAAPALEAGKQRLSVTVNGTIELKGSTD